MLHVVTMSRWIHSSSQSRSQRCPSRIDYEPMPCYKYRPHSESEKSTYKLYYDKSIITDLTTHNNRPTQLYQTKLVKK
jgi:hypothetical protein